MIIIIIIMMMTIMIIVIISSFLFFFQLLLPRNKLDIFPYLPEHTKARKKTQHQQQVDDSELVVHEHSLSKVAGNSAKETEIIQQLEIEEISLMKKLRAENAQKMESEADGKTTSGSPALYCLCRKPESGYMLQCELCHEWYHANCLHIPRGKRVPGRDTGRESRFICSSCQRTRRPMFSNLITLLVALNKVPVHIPEGTAVAQLAERSMKWQQKAKKVLQSCVSITESAKQQRRRIEDIKGHINRWRQEASTTLSNSSTTMQTQLANSAGEDR